MLKIWCAQSPTGCAGSDESSLGSVRCSTSAIAMFTKAAGCMSIVPMQQMRFYPHGPGGIITRLLSCLTFPNAGLQKPRQLWSMSPHMSGSIPSEFANALRMLRLGLASYEEWEALQRLASGGEASPTRRSLPYGLGLGWSWRTGSREPTIGTWRPRHAAVIPKWW